MLEICVWETYKSTVERIMSSMIIFLPLPWKPWEGPCVFGYCADDEHKSCLEVDRAFAFFEHVFNSHPSASQRAPCAR